MFSNVGMNPYGAGGHVVSQLSQPNTSAPGSDTRSSGAGEPVAAPKPTDGSERIEAPRQVGTAARTGRELGQTDSDGPVPASFIPRRMTLAPPAPDLAPPDDRAPSGPPPAFDRSPLQEQMQETARPDPSPATISAPARAEPDVAPHGRPSAESPGPTAEGDPLRDMIRRVMDADETAPAKYETHAEAEFSSTRRMDEARDTTTLDVTR